MHFQRANVDIFCELTKGNQKKIVKLESENFISRKQALITRNIASSKYLSSFNPKLNSEISKKIIPSNSEALNGSSIINTNKKTNRIIKKK